jgi:nucleotide-binding universal stress UspA family protein
VKRILITVDGSEHSELILGYVRDCFETGVVVRLVRVLTDRDLSSGEPGENVLAEARGHLDGLVAKLKKAGVETGSTVLVGDPAEKILELVASWRPDLVAMATHGRTGVARLVRGSVAERVLRECPRPVLLVNSFAEKRKNRITRILVPLDGSTPAASVVKLVNEIAEHNGSEVLLFHVVPGGGADANTSDALATRAAAKEYLATVEPLLGRKVRARIVTGSGTPAVAILRAASREKVDLIAMTTHGRSGVSRWVFGSVAENVLRACRSPILVQRTTAKD